MLFRRLCHDRLARAGYPIAYQAPQGWPGHVAEVTNVDGGDAAWLRAGGTPASGA